MARLIAVKRGIKGGFGENKASCESFEVDWKNEPANDFMDSWEAKNSDYKALWLTKLGESL